MQIFSNNFCNPKVHAKYAPPTPEGLRMAIKCRMENETLVQQIKVK